MKPYYLYVKYYCWVHIFAVSGVMLCVKSYDTYVNYQKENNDVSIPLSNIT